MDYSEVGTYLYHLVQKNYFYSSETIDESMYDMMMDGLKDLGLNVWDFKFRQGIL